VKVRRASLRQCRRAHGLSRRHGFDRHGIGCLVPALPDQVPEVTHVYRHVLIQTYRAYGEPATHPLRARPLPGQEVASEMRVECHAKMLESYPAGTIFKVWARARDTDGDPHLYTSCLWDYDLLSPEAAEQFIRTCYGARFKTAADAAAGVEAVLARGRRG